VLPSASQWFDLDRIHEFEMYNLPEYFNGQFPHKTPKTYFTHRNLIISMYRESPNAYLSVFLCTKNIASDYCSILRLHAFLEHWGIIN
jgi:SWI/SNF related-matrix-associated actin-dependent regulator of chromatin subfamily C